MIGIDYISENFNGKELKLLFSDFNKKDYKCYISEEVIYNTKEKNNDPKFKKNAYEIDEILKILDDDRYLLNFLILQIYPREKEKFEITFYEDFIKSDCEYMILCCDSHYIDIYSKNKNFLINSIEKIIERKGTNICIKTEYDDGRIKLSFD